MVPGSRGVTTRTRRQSAATSSADRPAPASTLRRDARARRPRARDRADEEWRLARNNRDATSSNVLVEASRMSVSSPGTSESTRTDIGGRLYVSSRPSIAGASPVRLCRWYEIFASGSLMSLPNASSATIRRRYSYWKKRWSGVRRSDGWVPPNTSNGGIRVTSGSSGPWSGTTVTLSVSTTEHVSTTEKGCPTFTAAALVRHQHCTGSVSTVCAEAEAVTTMIARSTWHIEAITLSLTGWPRDRGRPESPSQLSARGSPRAARARCDARGCTAPGPGCLRDRPRRGAEPAAPTPWRAGPSR